MLLVPGSPESLMMWRTLEEAVSQNCPRNMYCKRYWTNCQGGVEEAFSLVFESWSNNGKAAWSPPTNFGWFENVQDGLQRDWCALWSQECILMRRRARYEGFLSVFADPANQNTKHDEPLSISGVSNSCCTAEWHCTTWQKTVYIWHKLMGLLVVDYENCGVGTKESKKSII